MAPLARVFAPGDESKYVVATTPGEPSVVIDRTAGTVRAAAASELISLVGPHGQRAKSMGIAGMVGLISFADDQCLVVVINTASRAVATERGSASVASVTKTAFLPLKPLASAGAGADGQWQPPESSSGLEAESRAASAKALGDKQRAHLKELLESGDFFVAHEDRCALTHTVQRRAARAHAASDAAAESVSPLEAADPRFVWNRAALEPLVDAGGGPWLTPIMQASIQTEQVMLPAGGVLTASVIARRSCEHAGTRFKTRGLDDAGSAANFVEIEQVMHISSRRSAVTALVQARQGSTRTLALALALALTDSDSERLTPGVAETRTGARLGARLLGAEVAHRRGQPAAARLARARAHHCSDGRARPTSRQDVRPSALAVAARPQGRRGGALGFLDPVR